MIDEIEVQEVEMPLIGTLFGEFGSYRGIIGKARSDKAVFWGEMSISMEKFWILSKDFRNYLQEELLGKDAMKMLKIVYDSKIPFSPLVESIFLDMIGKSAGVPWSKLYGRKKEEAEVVYLTLAGGGRELEGGWGYYFLISSGDVEKDKLALSELEDLALIFYWPSKKSEREELSEFDFYLVGEDPSSKPEIPMINRENYLSFLHPKLLSEYSEYFEYAILDISSLGILRSLKLGNLLEVMGAVPIFYPGISTSILNSVAFQLATLFEEGKFILTSHVLYEDIARPCFQIEEGMAKGLGNPGIGAMISKTRLSKYSGRRWRESKS